MSTRLSTTGTLVLRNLGHSGNVAEGVDVGVTTQTKKEINGVNFLFKAAEDVRNGRRFTGGIIQASRAVGPITSTAAFDVASRGVTLTASTKDPSGRLEAKVAWVQKTNNLLCDLLLKPSPQHKLLTSFSPVSKFAMASYTFEQNGWIVQPAYNISKQLPALTLGRKFGRNIVRGAYAFKEKSAQLEWQHAPFKVTAKAPVTERGLGWVTMQLVFDRDFTIKAPAAFSKPAASAASAAPIDNFPIRTKEADFQAHKTKLPGGFESWSYKVVRPAGSKK